MNFAQIILPLNLKGTFTYKVPDELVENLKIGMRVLVSFRGKKIYTGIVAEIHQNDPETFVPKEIISILEEKSINTVKSKLSKIAKDVKEGNFDPKKLAETLNEELKRVNELKKITIEAQESEFEKTKELGLNEVY